MNVPRRSTLKQLRTNHHQSIHPKLFVFFDRKTSAPRFEVKAGPDGSMPVDEVVGLLAIHCLTRGQMPKDYTVMVAADENLLSGIVRRTTKLIQASLTTALPFELSHRQEEVLRGVLEDLSNKEIAARLNLSERTVKFHVSSLLFKFKVESRTVLKRIATDAISAHKLMQYSPASHSTSREATQMDALQSEFRSGLRALASSERRSAKLVLAKS